MSGMVADRDGFVCYVGLGFGMMVGTSDVVCLGGSVTGSIVFRALCSM